MARVRVAATIFSVVAIVALAACEGSQGPAGPAGPPGPSVILGYASVNASASPTLWHFGGEGTDSVTVMRSGLGDYEVRFHGNWGSFTDKHDVTVIGTIEQGDGNHVASASHTADGGAFADGTEIWTRVLIWKSDDLAPADRDFSVTMLR